ncbi:hypothetical protein GOB10_08665 [Sinorhizobium meliloti]|uniref:hypothetical protein n=1 Tax=Rhizobium meliloti TaxID=382 RepID=UPI0012963901|nr:hypothetical protein [Sinorhizobium meliloti]MDW9895847.1 hypothetical protein [Sinorhizobium meliloti]MQX32624.1 hypothetical protein [Sinorhizobium meliloti]
MKDDDEQLMAEINAQADRADRDRTQQWDLPAIANVLAAHFEHRSEEDILEQLKTVFRARGLFWRG